MQYYLHQIKKIYVEIQYENFANRSLKGQNEALSYGTEELRSSTRCNSIHDIIEHPGIIGMFWHYFVLFLSSVFATQIFPRTPRLILRKIVMRISKQPCKINQIQGIKDETANKGIDLLTSCKCPSVKMLAHDPGKTLPIDNSTTHRDPKPSSTYNIYR